MTGIRVINLEQGMPPRDTAMAHFEQSLRTWRSSGGGIIKYVHGYGSSGRGGRINREVRARLKQKKENGMIRDYILGEEFSPFYEPARNALIKYPQLAKDRDLNRCNHGITFVLL